MKARTLALVGLGLVLAGAVLTANAYARQAPTVRGITPSASPAVTLPPTDTAGRRWELGRRW